MPMRRISVVGNSGSGKSTLGRRLSGLLGVPFVELDSIYHQPDWTPLAAAEFTSRVAAAAADDGWVIDGNYRAVQPLIWARADTVIWIDLPKRTVMRQVTWRTIQRVIFHAELWNGNREGWRNLFTWDPGESVISCAWHEHARYRERYMAAAADPANTHICFVRIISRRDTRVLLAAAQQHRIHRLDAHRPSAGA
jgi:adenylate kinase family enzyme